MRGKAVATMYARCFSAVLQKEKKSPPFIEEKFKEWKFWNFDFSYFMLFLVSEQKDY